jgi:hypothetical protein
MLPYNYVRLAPHGAAEVVGVVEINAANPAGQNHFNA